ncbi:MAG: hypothetical protein ACTSQY_11065, partial [Candidatus Odinarchaeia archaeon]
MSPRRREEPLNFSPELRAIIDMLWEILYEDDPSELKRFLDYYKDELPDSVVYQALGWATTQLSDVNIVCSLIDALRERDMSLYPINFYSLLSYKQVVPEFNLRVKDMVSRFTVMETLRLAIGNRATGIAQLLFKEGFLRHTKKLHNDFLSANIDDKPKLIWLVKSVGIVPIGECGDFLLRVYKLHKDPELIHFLIQ